MSYINNSQTLIDIKNNTAITNASKAQERMGKTELGQDAFLQLMMVQLQHQDPMNPMNNQEFLAQQAQFTQVSELQKISAGMEALNSDNAMSNSIMQSSSLIGKEICYINPDYDPEVEGSEKYKMGIVDEAKFYKDATTLVVDGEEVLLGQVSSVGAQGKTTIPEDKSKTESETEK